MSLVQQSTLYGNVLSKSSKSRAKRNDTNFPGKLMQILSRNDVSDIITWMPNGRSFMFLDPDRFTNEILPNYFRKSKFTSFVRKLYRWGFRQIRKGPDSDSYFHLLFQREKKCLLKHLSCRKNDPSHDLASSLGVPPTFESVTNSSTEKNTQNNAMEGVSAEENTGSLRGMSTRAPKTSSECTQFNYPIESSSKLHTEQEQPTNQQDIPSDSSMTTTNPHSYNLIFNPLSLIATNMPNYGYSSWYTQAAMYQQYHFNSALQNVLTIRQPPSE